MPAEFIIPAGTRTRVLWVFSSSIPGAPRFRAEPLQGSELTGSVEVVRKRLLSTETDQHPLRPQNVFAKGFWDSDYKIFVTPDQDCRVTFETRHFRAEVYFKILAAVLILGVLSAITAFIFANPGGPGG